MPLLQQVSTTSLFGKRERKISVRPGLDVILGDFRLDSPGAFSFCHSGKTCELAFVLSGTIMNQSPTASGKVVVPPRHAAVWTPSCRQAVHGCLPGEDIRFVCISLRRSLLDSILATERPGQSLAGCFPDSSGQDAALRHLSPMSLAMQAAVQQIFCSTYQGRAGRLFMEAKALELLSHLLAEVDGSAQPGDDPARSLDPRIRLARRLLLDNMASPPNLTELAGQAGLSVTALTRGFRSAFGLSVFEFLRGQRLEKARLLLETGEVNVTEAAYAVGFSSPAHLTRLFSRHFKMTPSQFRQGVLHRK